MSKKQTESDGLLYHLNPFSPGSDILEDENEDNTTFEELLARHEELINKYRLDERPYLELPRLPDDADTGFNIKCSQTDGHYHAFVNFDAPQIPVGGTCPVCESELTVRAVRTSKYMDGRTSITRDWQEGQKLIDDEKTRGESE